MVPVKRPVNEGQLSVLQWVEVGCPEDVWETNSHKTTCQALQNRGLVTVSRKVGQWSVVLTSAGQHYLSHDTCRRPGSLPRMTKATAPQRSSPRTQDTPAVEPKPSPPQQNRVTFTEQLLQEFADAGGRIVKTNTGRDSVNWPSRIAAARRSTRLPKTAPLPRPPRRQTPRGTARMTWKERLVSLGALWDFPGTFGRIKGHGRETTERPFPQVRG